jgi:GH15 family glucan-1,4-alpha-glucosidase
MLERRADGTYAVDGTVDSSLFALFAFDVFAPDQPEVMRTMRAVEERLSVKTSTGGVARYERDSYYRVGDDFEQVPGNPWFICTLWVVEWRIRMAQTLADLERPRAILEWVAAHALPSGVLAEQLNPYTGAPLSVSPLTWSHAAYIETFLHYCAKYQALAAPRRSTRRRGARPSVHEPAG